MEPVKIAETVTNIGTAGTPQLILMIIAFLFSVVGLFWWKRKKVAMAKKESQREQNRASQEVVTENQELSREDRETEAGTDDFLNS